MFGAVAMKPDMGKTAENDETPAERQARLHDLSRERPAPERIARSDELEEMRSDRAENLEDRRVERATQLRVQEALRSERLDARLTGHEQRLNNHRERLDAINGSVARAAQSLERIETKLNTNDAVNVALIEAAAGKGAKRLTTFQQVGIVLMGVFALGSLIIAILQSVHG